MSRSRLFAPALVVLGWLFLCPGVPAVAADAPAADVPAVGTVTVPTLASPPSMQGVLDVSWDAAAKLTLGTDFTYRHPVAEATEVRIAQDGAALDIAFVVTQTEPLTQRQQTNGSSVTSDDYVGVYLYPHGTVGFQYAFFANPLGTRYQTSSENSAYTPQWVAIGHATPTGYVVTMRIPLDAIRSGGSKTWRAQFVRATVATNGLAAWTFSMRANNVGNPAFAGTLEGVGEKAVAVRPKARAQIYALGEATTPANGGNTSRIGGDFSLPITPTASFVATLHPDYSNVEVDQQTIAPSAFAYQYSEVRPFFTQAAPAFNYNFSCSDCVTLLYTPAIPTFREGYALEGTQGPVTFGAFDALGNGRVDQGEAFDYNRETQENVFSGNFQRVAVDTSSGLHDELNSFQGGISNQKTHFFVYGNVAFERGSQVTVPGVADYQEYGIGYASATTVAVLNAQRVGAQFDPVDSFVQQTDLTGYEWYAKKTINFSPTFWLHDISVNEFYARYHNSLSQLDQADANEFVGLDFRNLITFRFNLSANGVQVSDREFLPFDGNAVYLGYKVNTVTPTYVRHTYGNYYHGQLDANTFLTVRPLRKRLNLTLEADQDTYRTHYPGETTTQWLERATLDWQITRDASFDVGARRILGGYLPNSFALPPFGAANAGNVSLAFHLLNRRNEFYIVYGDPNSLATTPALFLKWIRYIGAPKGT
jgi:hypothetical protein